MKKHNARKSKLKKQLVQVVPSRYDKHNERFVPSKCIRHVKPTKGS